MTWVRTKEPPLRNPINGEMPDMVELAGIANTLNPAHRKVGYWLCRFADLKLKDIAIVCHVSKRTLDNRLYEMRKAFGVKNNGMLMYYILGLDFNGLVDLNQWRDGEKPAKRQKIPARKLNRLKTKNRVGKGKKKKEAGDQ